LILKGGKNKWIQSRREFLKNSSLLLIGGSMPWFFTSCSDDELISHLKVFDLKQYNLLKKIHNILFPRDEFGPGADDLKSVEYLDWVLSDEHFDKELKEYLLKGIRWIRESSEEELNMEFDDLSQEELSELVAVVSKTSWGESWLSYNLTFILEANFSDELYGSNKSEIGWKWLNHYPGYPRPTIDMIYDNIFESISSKVYNKI